MGGELGGTRGGDSHMRTHKLNACDHKLLLCLIQGMTIVQSAVYMSTTEHALRTRLARMRDVMECETTYQLIAMAVVFFMENEQYGVELPVKTAVAVA